MRPTSHLRSFQALELALRTGSLTAAAEQLAITPAAVGQRIKALEEFLGVDLLVRGRSGLKPTAELAGALPHLSAAFHELGLAAERLELQRGHEIHVAAAPDFADLWLTPRLAKLRAEHPNLRFNINGEGDAPLRLAPADCEIDFGPARPGWEPLFRDYLVPVCSPEIHQRFTALPELDRLEGFPLLHLDLYRDDPDAPSWPSWVATHKVQRTAPERGIRFRRLKSLLEAVLADAGLGICGVALAADLVERLALALPYPANAGVWTSNSYHARFRSDAQARAPMRLFREWLLAEAQASAAWTQRFAHR